MFKNRKRDYLRLHVASDICTAVGNSGWCIWDKSSDKVRRVNNYFWRLTYCSSLLWPLLDHPGRRDEEMLSFQYWKIIIENLLESHQLVRRACHAFHLQSSKVRHFHMNSKPTSYETNKQSSSVAQFKVANIFGSDRALLRQLPTWSQMDNCRSSTRWWSLNYDNVWWIIILNGHEQPFVPVSIENGETLSEIDEFQPFLRLLPGQTSFITPKALPTDTTATRLSHAVPAQLLSRLAAVHYYVSKGVKPKQRHYKRDHGWKHPHAPHPFPLDCTCLSIVHVW